MIIFDLDGTLANCEHRRHFVDPKYRLPPTNQEIFDYMTAVCRYEEPPKWKPDWDAFHEACEKDTPIRPVIHILEYIGEAGEYGCDTPWVSYDNIQIWSGRSESVRKKTEKWLSKNVRYFNEGSPLLKMRPIGDYTPDDQLKERWLDEAIAEGKTIEFVFDDRPKVIRMWQRRGIFVFNCNQKEGEF